MELADQTRSPRAGEELGIGIPKMGSLDVPPVLGDAAEEELEPA